MKRTLSSQDQERPLKNAKTLSGRLEVIDESKIECLFILVHALLLGTSLSANDSPREVAGLEVADQIPTEFCCGKPMRRMRLVYLGSERKASKAGSVLNQKVAAPASEH